MENNIPNNDNNISNHVPESNPYNDPNNIPNNMSGSDPSNSTYSDPNSSPYNDPYSDSYNNPYNDPSNMSGDVPYDIPEEYRPISMWGYVGYLFLFAIPLVGFILTIVYGFGGAGKQNINLQNFARAMFVCWLIILILNVLLFVGVTLSVMLFFSGC